MIPVGVLVVVTLALRAAGALGIVALASWSTATRLGLAAMLVLTASGHFGTRRCDFVAMVPSILPNGPMLVTITGVLELGVAAALIAGGSPARVAAMTAIVLFGVMFPANVRAARAGIGVGGRPPTPLVPRAVMQLVFIAAAVAVLL